MGFVWTALLFLFFFQHDARHFVVVNFAEMQLFFATRLVGPRAVSTYIAGKTKVPSNAYEAVECAQGVANKLRAFGEDVHEFGGKFAGLDKNADGSVKHVRMAHCGYLCFVFLHVFYDCGVRFKELFVWVLS